MFNVTATSGDLHKIEVRVFHSAVADTNTLGCDVSNGVHLKLLKVNDKNETTKIDQVIVHFNEEGWVIFDSMNYDWKLGENGMHRLAIAVSGNCKDVSLTKLGFDITNEVPILIVFASQEEVMTEVNLLPPSLVNEFLDSETSDKQYQKRQMQTTKRCQLESYTVR